MMPNLAPGIRDKASVNGALDRKPDHPVVDSDIKRVANQERLKGAPNNNLIVCGQENLFLEAAILYIQRDKMRDLNRVRQLIEAKSVPVLAGYEALTNSFYLTLRIINGLTSEVAKCLVHQDIVTRLPLGWLTPESENQT